MSLLAINNLISIGPRSILIAFSGRMGGRYLLYKFVGVYVDAYGRYWSSNVAFSTRVFASDAKRAHPTSLKGPYLSNQSELEADIFRNSLSDVC